MAEVARAEELAHNDTLPVASGERLRSDIGDVASRNRRDGEVRRNGVPVDPFVLDEPEHIVEVLEERYRPEEQHVRTFEVLEAFLLRVQARDRTGPPAQIRSQAAQRDDVPD